MTLSEGERGMIVLIRVMLENFRKDRKNSHKKIYSLREYILGSGAPGTNAVGASGAINGMKRWSVTDTDTHVHVDAQT